MKTKVFILICLMVSSVVFGQDPKNEKSETIPAKFIAIENGKDFYNDNSELLKNYLSKHIIYPKDAIKYCQEGTEVIKFKVTPAGNITDIEVVNCVCCEIDNEISRVLKETDGMWLPAYKDGKPVETEQELSMVFCINNSSRISSHFVAKATFYFNKGNEKFFEKQNPEKSIQLYNRGLVYLPNDNALLFMRGVSNYEIGNKEAAIEDWNRIADLGGIVPEGMENKIAGMKGYTKMKEILARNK